MNEIIMSWPWYDRLIAGLFLTSVIAGFYVLAQISDKLSRIIQLLQNIANKD